MFVVFYFIGNYIGNGKIINGYERLEIGVCKASEGAYNSIVLNL